MLNFAKLYNQTINHLILFSMKNKYFAGVIGILMCAAMCVFSSCADTKLKNAVEKAFGVEVKSVNTLVTKPKDKRVGRYTGQTKTYKKAIVTLKDGQQIEI